MTETMIWGDIYMVALVDFWLCWSHKSSVEGKKGHKWHAKTVKSSLDVFLQLCPYCSQWSLLWNSRSAVFYWWPNHLWPFRWQCRIPLQVRYCHVTDRCSRSPAGWRAGTEWGSSLRTAAKRSGMKPPASFHSRGSRNLPSFTWSFNWS